MNTQSVILFVTEKTHVKLGKEWYVHSVAKTSLHVPLANVKFSGDNALWVVMGDKGQRFILNSEITDVQFV